MTVERDRAGSDARRMLRAFIGGVFALCALIASGCGTTNYLYGTPVITVSNVPGRFSSYVVYVDSIALTRNDGAVIYPLGVAERMDLSKLNDMSELLGAPAGITGTYLSASITVDYTSAIIAVDINGVPQVATVLDTTGLPAGPQSFTVTFDPAHPLILTNSVSNAMDVNFDLTAATTINTSTSPVSVTVRPFVTFSTVPAASKPVRVRGEFVVADTTASNFIMNTRPFFDETATLGAVTIQTNAQTTYNVNGVAYVGAAGLAQVAQTQENFNVVAYGSFGSLAGVTPVFNATQVYSGTSLESTVADQVYGTISYRSGDTLNVHSALIFNRCGEVYYYPNLPLQVGSATNVSMDGYPGATGLSAQSLSVGQQVRIGGQADPTCLQISSAVDATAGLVRMQPTAAWGTLNSAAAGTATLTLASLGGFAPVAFNFAGTGSSVANNANPAAYVASTGTVDESGTAAGTLVRLDGFVNTYGAAPPDFNAVAATVGTATDQQLVVDWSSSGATAPFLSAGASGLAVNMALPTRSEGFVQTGPTILDLTTPAVNVTIVPDTSRTDQFAIGNVLNGLAEFNSFASYLTKISSFLNGTNALQKLVAVGHYDAASQTFTAYRIDMVQQ